MKLYLSKPCFIEIPFKKDNTGWRLKISQYFYANHYPKLYNDISKKLAHGALDLRTPHGTPIYSSHDGYVLQATTDNASRIASNPTGTNALYIRLVTDREYDYKGTKVYFWTTYVHLKSFAVKKGQKVKRGDLIGYADNTGYSSGNHTHFGLCPVIKMAVDWYNKYEPNNGYAGYINPMPFLTNMFSRLKVKGSGEQYILDDYDKLHKIPDVKTLTLLVSMGYADTLLSEVTQEQFDKYEIGTEIESAKVTHRYVIDSKKRQYILYDDLRVGFKIEDPAELQELFDAGLQGEYMPITDENLAKYKIKYSKIGMAKQIIEWLKGWAGIKGKV